jgi:hypothetical protein
MTLTEASSVIASPEHELVDVAGCDADCIVIWLQGEHDISTVTALSQTMAQIVAIDGGDQSRHHRRMPSECTCRIRPQINCPPRRAASKAGLWTSGAAATSAAVIGWL